MAGADLPVLALACNVLPFLPPSIMVRTTCRMFKTLTEKIHGLQWKKKRLTLAADAAASVRLVRWAMKLGLDLQMALRSVVRHGDLKGLHILHVAFKVPLHAALTRAAAVKGHLHVLQWLRARYCPWDERVCKTASQRGHLELLRWVCCHGCPLSRWTCHAAAKYGHLEVVQWARISGFPWGRDVCATAARHGRLEVLQWVCVNGCPWDADTCTLAAQNGHLAVLQWACVNGCPFDSGACLFVAAGHPHIREWLRANVL